MRTREEREENIATAKSRREIPFAEHVRDCSVYGVVGERCIWGEVRAEALVDCMEVRMPE